MRPDRSQRLKEAVWRWREAFAGLAVLALGLWIAFASFGATRVLGYLLSAAGVVLVIAGVQRARFRIGSGGPGVVMIREALVTYFGPLSGGAVNIGSLSRLELDGSARPFPSWILTEPGQPPLAIPTTAENAEALFDVFTTLPGIQTERMLAALQRPTPGVTLIWGASYESPKLRRVH